MPAQVLLDDVFGNEDVLKIIFSTLKPLSDKRNTRAVCRKFCGALSEPAYNHRRQWLLARSRYAREFKVVLNQRPWSTCGCLRIVSGQRSVSAIYLTPRCGHFQSLLALVKQTRDRSYDQTSKAWHIDSAHLRGLLDRVYRSEPEVLLPWLHEALQKLEAPGPPAPTGEAACGDDPTRDYSRFGGVASQSARMPTLRAREMTMREDEARLRTQHAEYFRRDAALQELREAVRASSIDLTPRVWPGDGEEELRRLSIAIKEAQITQVTAANDELLATASALQAELRSEQARAAEAASQALREAARVAAAARLRTALDASSSASGGSTAQRLQLITDAIRTAEAVAIDDAVLLADASLRRDHLATQRAQEAQQEAAARAQQAQQEAAARRTAIIERLSRAVVRAWWVVAEPPDQDHVAEPIDALEEVVIAMREAEEANLATDTPFHGRSPEGRPLLQAAREATGTLAQVVPPEGRSRAALLLCDCNREDEDGDEGHHVCRFFGEFTCHRCRNRWESGNTYIDLGKKVPQRCRRCHTAVVPHTVRLLESRGDGGGGDHMAELCGRCEAKRRRTGDPHARCDDDRRLRHMRTRDF